MSTTDNSFGSAIALGDVPNSMVFDRSGTNLYIGTNTGLITLSTATNAPTAVATGIPGTVLAVSPDGSLVLISNPAKTQVFAFSPSGPSFLTLNVIGATAAAFSPDNSKAYILGNNTLSIYSGGSITSSVTITGAQSASFLASGSVGFIAASGSSLGSKATCNDLDEGVTTMAHLPTLVSALPDGHHLVTANSPNMSLIAVDTGQNQPNSIENKGFLANASGCAPFVSGTESAFSFTGISAFAAKQLIVTPDGTKAFVTSDQGSLLGINTGATPTDASIPLSGGAVPTTGGVTIDSKLIFVGGSDGKIHRVDLSASPATDTLISIPTTAPAGFKPDFVAVQPR
jgi:hypothetical protein